MAESINNTVKGKNVACNKRSVVIHRDEAIRRALQLAMEVLL